MLLFAAVAVCVFFSDVGKTPLENRSGHLEIHFLRDVISQRLATSPRVAGSGTPAAQAECVITYRRGKIRLWSSTMAPFGVRMGSLVPRLWVSCGAACRVTLTDCSNNVSLAADERQRARSLGSLKHADPRISNVKLLKPERGPEMCV